MAPKNRAVNLRGLESPGPIFKTLTLTLVSFSQTVHRPLSIPTWLQQLEACVEPTESLCKMKRHHGSSCSDGDGPARREKLGMQETRSLNWAVIGLWWGLHLETRPVEGPRPFIPVIKGKEGGWAQGKMSALLCWPGGEDFVWGSFCPVGVIPSDRWLTTVRQAVRSSAESTVWKASGWCVCWDFEKREVNSDSHFGEWGHQHRRISEKWLWWPGRLEGPSEICIYEF